MAFTSEIPSDKRRRQASSQAWLPLVCTFMSHVGKMTEAGLGWQGVGYQQEESPKLFSRTRQPKMQLCDVHHVITLATPCVGWIPIRTCTIATEVKSIAGEDVLNEEPQSQISLERQNQGRSCLQDFEVIMKKLGDEALGYKFNVDFPLEVTFAKMPSSG